MPSKSLMLSGIVGMAWSSRSTAERAKDLIVSVDANTLPWQAMASQTDAGMAGCASARMTSGCHIMVSIIWLGISNKSGEDRRAEFDWNWVHVC
jgi:hypothetical protein